MKDNVEILIIAPRYTFTDGIDYRYTLPLGLAYISSALKQAGRNVSCLNLNHIRGSVKNIVDRSLSEKIYDYVLTGGHSLIYPVIEKILDAARGHPTRPVTVLGGPILTSEPELIFNSLQPDFGVIGEGERTIVELLDCVGNGRSPEDVKGVMCRDKDGKVRFTGFRPPIENLDSVAFPDAEGLGLDEQLNHIHANDLYHYNAFDNPRPYYLLASRGCPFRCTFCYHYEKYRPRSMDNVMKEIRAAIGRYGINILVVLDECFSIKKDRLNEFCERIKEFRKEAEMDLKWTCQMIVASVDRDRLMTMKESGCYAISYGFESYSAAVLKSMQKPIKPEQIDRALRMTLEAGIAVQANFIFGDAAETLETAKETLDYYKKNCRGQVNLYFIQPYPGSEIYEHCIKKGIITDRLEFIKNILPTQRIFNMTDRLSEEEFERLKNEVLDTESACMKRATPMSIRKIKRDAYDIKLKCPYCGAIITYGNCYIGNRFLYRFRLICRSCHMGFYVVNLLQRIIWVHHWKLSGSRTLKILRRVARF